MQHKIYNSALLLFFAYSALIWVLWGIICVTTPEAWAGQAIPGIDIFDLSKPEARTEVRAMYGGLQIAIGLFAIVAIIKPKHRESVLLFYVLALTGLAASRLYGIVLEGSEKYIIFATEFEPRDYNEVGLGMYEGPSLLWSWLLILLKPNR